VCAGYSHILCLVGHQPFSLIFRLYGDVQGRSHLLHPYFLSLSSLLLSSMVLVFVLTLRFPSHMNRVPCDVVGKMKVMSHLVRSSTAPTHNSVVLSSCILAHYAHQSLTWLDNPPVQHRSKSSSSKYCESDPFVVDSVYPRSHSEWIDHSDMNMYCGGKL
jgi:hypothetical protein